ncbi:MAG: hypothetical protein CMH54_06475 [Myxococcales bacterium]|nr:hypothetical protein [Myxococcales bacterium]
MARTIPDIYRIRTCCFPQPLKTRDDYMRSRSIRTILSFGIIYLCLAFAGCASESDMGPLEIEGVWNDAFGGTETITSESWETDWGSSTVISYDNDINQAILQIAADDEYNPNKYAKVRWTELAEDRFFYCWVAFGFDTLEEAEEAEDTSDLNDPANGGCGGFAWSELSLP